ncbi:NAD(P)/FAD-dependent oxidoreductase, partial [Mesorhizobium sp. M4A.F.Ca.ET.050.02.1.1]
RQSNLERVRWRNRATGADEQEEMADRPRRLGADPNTDWLAKCNVALDAKGFVRTGAEVAPRHGLMETSRSGVFAIGDVRCGSIKRVAAAVGEGAQVVAALHAYLAQNGGGVQSEPARRS